MFSMMDYLFALVDRIAARNFKSMDIPLGTNTIKSIGQSVTVLFKNKMYVHSVQQKSIGLKFSKSRNGSDVRYSCHHNSSRFTFPIYTHSWRFSVFHSLQSITPRIY